MWDGRVSWDDRVLEATEIGSNAIVNEKPLAGEPYLMPLAMENCHLVLPENSTCVVLLQ